jgi:hypothetical protein
VKDGVLPSSSARKRSLVGEVALGYPHIQTHKRSGFAG